MFDGQLGEKNFVVSGELLVIFSEWEGLFSDLDCLEHPQVAHLA